MLQNIYMGYVIINDFFFNTPLPPPKANDSVKTIIYMMSRISVKKHYLHWGFFFYNVYLILHYKYMCIYTDNNI
jgi:hypothetical protein